MTERLVFVVEDDRKIAAVLADYLGAAGYAARIFADGRKVVDAVRTTPPSAIILDRTLPAGDGMAICVALLNGVAPPLVLVLMPLVPLGSASLRSQARKLIVALPLKPAPGTKRSISLDVADSSSACEPLTLSTATALISCEPSATDGRTPLHPPLPSSVAWFTKTPSSQSSICGAEATSAPERRPCMRAGRP